MKSSGLRRALARPFVTHGRLDWGVLAAFLAINGLVLANAVLHRPEVGYDAEQHLVHVDVLSELRLVTRKDSDTFYYPPLPYLLPALIKGASGMSLHAAAKLAQGLNVLLSLGLTTLLLAACRELSPSRFLRLGALVALGGVPVYYRTFAFVRGEPYVAFFATLALYLGLRLFARGRPRLGVALAFGLALGLAGLSRQWGLFLLPAAGLAGLLHVALRRRRRLAAAGALALALLVGSGVGLAWVGVQRARFGDATKFNRRPAPCFSFANQSPRFYTGLGDGLLFERPVRPSFPNQLLPIFYSELWGDYWGHFLVYGVDTRTRDFVQVRYIPWKLKTGGLPDWVVTNYEDAMPELARLNLVSLVPTAIGLVALAFAAWCLVAPRTPRRRREAVLLALGALVFSAAGYLWFLIMYPNPGRGDTIKATYVLHVLPFVALLVGLLLERARAAAPLVARFLLLLLVAAALHDSTAMVTRCTTARLEAAAGR